eukprot:scaffold2128_cov371-Prasinococcus_capsulatus_cf.AAC.3
MLYFTRYQLLIEVTRPKQYAKTLNTAVPVRARPAPPSKCSRPSLLLFGRLLLAPRGGAWPCGAKGAEHVESTLFLVCGLQYLKRAHEGLIYGHQCS